MVVALFGKGGPLVTMGKRNESSLNAAWMDETFVSTVGLQELLTIGKSSNTELVYAY